MNGTAVKIRHRPSRATSLAFQELPAKSKNQCGVQRRHPRRSPVSIDADWLAELERRDNIFPTSTFAYTPWPRSVAATA